MTPRRRGRPRRDEYLTPAEASAWLKARGREVSGRTIARECDAGRIPCYRTRGNYRRILPESIEEYLRTALDRLDEKV